MSEKLILRPSGGKSGGDKARPLTVVAIDPNCLAGGFYEVRVKETPYETYLVAVEVLDGELQPGWLERYTRKR